MAKQRTCRKGEWMLVEGGSYSVRGIRGCYKTEAHARRALQRQHPRTRYLGAGDPRYMDFWVERKK